MRISGLGHQAAMPLRLEQTDDGFEAAFDALLTMKREVSVEVDQAVAGIVDAVRRRGDAALLDYTARFDGVALDAAGLRVAPDEIAAAEARCAPGVVAALTLAAGRIEAFHRRQLPTDERFTDSAGIELGHRWTPVAAAGLYVPGGAASYPSSVLMNAIPARVAGVPRLVMTVPMREGAISPLVLTAAKLAGVTEIYRVGGAQAVAALAFGTATIRPVDKVVGPGNAYVAAAKRQVFGTVGIDMIAGPSEILVVADSDNDPAWIAADLLSQAEHDASAQSILITDDPAFADAVAAAVEAALSDLARPQARQSWDAFGAIVVVRRLEDAAEGIRKVLGDSRTGQQGTRVRPPGRL
jgi:histidinol dehydrogenase